jgi:hypothetical protein
LSSAAGFLDSSSTCILSSSFSVSFASAITTSSSGTSVLLAALTPSQVGPYYFVSRLGWDKKRMNKQTSPRRFTPLRSPSGNTPLKKVNIRPQNIVVEPILESRRRRSLSVRKRVRALPFAGTSPTVSRSARSSIQENMCEHDAIV